MLRNKVGDKTFQTILQTYYSSYKFSNASSADFARVAEQVSGIELKSFFTQWLRMPGIPQLSARLSLKKKNMTGLIIQLQKNVVYEFPLQLKINFADGSSIIETINISEKVTKINKSYSKKISSFVLDPNVKLLFEEVR